MHVKSLWRYPVKSMQGEICDELHCDQLGVRGDRSYGVVDCASGTVISAKRDGRLLEAWARLSDDGLVVTLPNGASYSPGGELDAALSSWLEREAVLVDAATFGVATFESPEDVEHDDSALVRWQSNGYSFVDEGALLILTTADLAQLAQQRPDLQWTAQRFRPNILVEADRDELGLDHLGDALRVGAAEVRLEKGCTRCVMITRAQPNGLARQLDIFRHVLREHDNVVGLRARVVQPAVVRRGDEVVRSLT